MIKLLVWLVGVVIVLTLFAVGLNSFLTPNDLSQCGVRPDASENCWKADAIIAVSGGDTPARAQSAVDLYKNGWSDRIIFSGAARDPESQSNAEAMKETALQAGVPSSAIVIEEVSKNTTENAINTAGILQKHKVKTAILTTSPYHMRRTAWEFQRAAPEVEFRSRPSDDRYWHLWFLKPSGWWRALNELGGLVVFGLRGVF